MCQRRRRSISPAVIDTNFGLPTICANGGKDLKGQVENYQSIYQRDEDWFRERICDKIDQILDGGQNLDISQQWWSGTRSE